MEALTRKKRQDETQITTKIDGFLSFLPRWMLVYFIGGFFWISPSVWPNSAFCCCVFLTIRITLFIPTFVYHTLMDQNQRGTHPQQQKSSSSIECTNASNWVFRPVVHPVVVFHTGHLKLRWQHLHVSAAACDRRHYGTWHSIACHRAKMCMILHMGWMFLFLFLNLGWCPGFCSLGYS